MPELARLKVLFSTSDRTMENGFKLKQRKVRSNIWGKIFNQRVVRCWHSCPVKLWCPIPGGAQGQVGWGPGHLSWWGAALPTAALPMAGGLELDNL